MIWRFAFFVPFLSCWLTASATAAATPTPTPVTHTVVVGAGGGFTFNPSSVTINAGDTVEWTWSSSGHNVVSGSGCAANSQFCSPNDTSCAAAPLSSVGTKYRHTFTAQGSYPYFCSQHCGLGMVGTVTVTCGPDSDGDGICDANDNCPYAANPGQQDTGGIGVSSGPDGIGDACQCGDVNGNGQVTIADSVIILRSLLSPPTATQTRPGLCDAGGSAGCSLADSVILLRASLSPPTATVVQQCAPAVGPAAQ